MKKILLPTDLSELGDYAYSIANNIAKKTNAEIIALFVLPGPGGAYYSKSGHLLDDEGEDFSEWRRRLDEKKSLMSDWVANKTDITSSICTIGDIDRTILSTSENMEVDLIVMGTEGLFPKSLWSKGSHTEYVTNHSDIPILSLKCDRSNLDLMKIVLVSDFLEHNVFDLRVLKTLQEVYQSTIVLLKIETPDSKRTKAQVYEDMKAFAGHNMLNNYTMNVYQDGSVEAGIGKFCAEQDIDLIVLGTHQLSGISRLFKHSVSNDVVNHLFHPILTFPIKSL